MQLSNLIGKQIFSPTGEALGYVKSALCSRDLQKLTALACIDDEEEEFFLSLRAVRSVKDAVIATNARLSSPNGQPVPVGKQLFTHLGEERGVVCDLVWTDAPYLIASQDGVTENYPLDNLVVGKTVIVYPSPEEKPQPKRRTPKKPKQNASTPPAKVQNVPPVSEVSQALPPPTNALPLHRLDLIGRVVKRTVYTLDGAPLITAGERVTPQTLLVARKHNRLLQLTVNTLSNLV